MHQESAQKRVFALPEITQSIFLLLSPCDLLVRVQRVNKAWHTTIKSSFQHHLFFEPLPQNLTRELDFNPLLVEAFPHFFTHATEPDLYGQWPQESLGKTDWASSDAKIDAYQRKEASWRQMLVIQPPAARMDIIKSAGGETSSSKQEGNLLTPHGLKMGELYDSVEELVHSGDEFDSNWFDIQWHMFAPPEGYVAPHLTSWLSEKNRVTVHLSHGTNCCPVGRDDFLMPAHLKGKDFSEYTLQDQSDYSIASMTNERPHLRSHAFSTVPVEWGELVVTEEWWG